MMFLYAGLLFLSWLIFGLIAASLFVIDDMKNTEYDEDYFTGDVKMAYFILTILGYLSMLFTIIYYIITIFRKSKFIHLNKILYKIANIKSSK